MKNSAGAGGRFSGAIMNAITKPGTSGFHDAGFEFRLQRHAGFPKSLPLLVVFGVAVTLITETLGVFHLLRWGPLLAVWVFLGAGAAWFLWRRVSFRIPRIALFDAAVLAGIAAILILVACTAVLSPPNSADAMAYHMPRVVYWAQAGSVSFFPTHYYNQIMLAPLAEYIMLHTYVLSGGDRWINLVQWMGFAGCVIGVSLIARELGAGVRGQVIAAAFCATLPNGILQASGAKNDCLLALWLVALVHFALRLSMVGVGLSLGLALMTKGTAYLFAPAVLLLTVKRDRTWLLRALPVVIGCTLLLNGPQYWRNFVFSGSVLGYDSAQGDGLFRWRNESLGWRPTVSNLMRNTAVHLGARSPRWNRAVYDLVARAHRWMGIDLNDPATTWRWSQFQPPANSNHEADAPNRWHLVLIVMAALPLALARLPRSWLWYYLGISLGFLLFCFYLKWMPWITRLHLPLFVLASPLAGLLCERLLPSLPQALLCLFLLNSSRPYLFENWTRPLTGPAAVWRTARNDSYFADMKQWDNRAAYLRAVDLVRSSGCDKVGIDIRHLQLEYPLQALLRQAVPGVRFMHVGVRNASSRYRPEPAFEPCAVVCLNCAGEEETLGLYRGFAEAEVVDRFVLLFRR